MRKKILTIVLSFTIVLNLYCQKHQENNGIIITNSQDTLRGLIKYVDAERNLTEIEYLTGTKSRRFGVSDIQSFEIPGKLRFESKKLNYCTNPLKFELLTYSKEIQMKEEQVFLRALVFANKINLFEFVDSDGKEHFVMEYDDGKLIDLIELHYKVYSDVAKIPKYKNQLRRVFYGCEPCNKYIDKMALKEKSLRKLINIYNEEVNGQTTYVSKKEKLGIQVSILGGASFTNQLVNKEKLGSQSIDGSGEIQFETVFPRNNRSWSLLLGGGYRRYDTGRTVFNRGGTELNYLRTNFGVKRILLNKEFKVHINAGIINSFVIKHDLPNLEKFEQALYLGSGLLVKNILFDVRYEISNGYSPFSGMETRIQTLFVFVGYRLYKNKYAH